MPMPRPNSPTPPPARNLREVAVVVLTYVAATFAAALALPAVVPPPPIGAVLLEAQPVVARSTASEPTP